MSNTFGTLFKITSFGESHGPAVGCVIDGCPSGIKLDVKELEVALEARKPRSKFGTARKETDKVEILSGIFEGKTLGTPIAIMVLNEDVKSKDYDHLKNVFRPGHADLAYQLKYGHRDYRGGGRSSGRETVARVIAGAVAKKLLSGVKFEGMVTAIAWVEAVNKSYKFAQSNPLFFADQNKLETVEKFLKEVKDKGDSVGGVIELRVKNLKSGFGEPVFDKLEAKLAQACLSIGGVRAIEFGDGIKAASSLGSEFNDEILNLKGKTKTNHSGGISGGISNGNDLVLRLYIKPTPSISIEQETINRQGKKVKLKIKGRHDTCIVPRVLPVVEAMVAITLADFYLIQNN